MMELNIQKTEIPKKLLPYEDFHINVFSCALLLKCANVYMNVDQINSVYCSDNEIFFIKYFNILSLFSRNPRIKDGKIKSSCCHANLSSLNLKNKDQLVECDHSTLLSVMFPTGQWQRTHRSLGLL